MVSEVDVVVVGSGNAAFCAGIAALEHGASVRMLEKAPEAELGGNSRYTAGAMRFAYASRADLEPLLTTCDDARLARADFGAYPEEKFRRDLASFGGGRPLTEPQEALVAHSLEAVRWMAGHGVAFEPIWSRQAFERDGRLVFWGGLTLCARGEGEGLIGALRRRYEELGGELRTACEARSLVTRADGAVCGARVVEGGVEREIPAQSVVLACGGFEANAGLRAEHLGEAWRNAKVRGTPHNDGAGIEMAVAAGAARAGHYRGCHAVPMDLHMPNYGNPAIPHLERKNYRKISYAFGVMLNAHGRRFVDEGADFRNYTYAQYGRAVLEQPGGFAYQVFDDQVRHLLYEEYRTADASFVEEATLAELTEQLDGVDAAAALEELERFNASVRSDLAFDPTRKDGRATRGVSPPKSNWALALEQPPFRAYPVTCGVTFTYGGLRVSTLGRVERADGVRVPGLFACGELVGDLFFEGYPGGSGLTAGAVFGRQAGRSAARDARD